MTTGLSFSINEMKAVCEGCGNEFTQTDHRQRVCRKNCSRYDPPKRVRFCGVDGEGSGSDPSCYVLFGVGDRHIENPDGLKWKEIFEFLYGEFERRGKGVAFVGFFLGYDFTQIFKSLPEDRARILLTGEGKAKRKHRVKGKEPHPVVCGQWEFDVLGMKRLRIRPHDCGHREASCGCKKRSWCYLCDVGGFWQTSFLNVIDPKKWVDPIVTQEEFDAIKEGKERRSNAVLDDDMRTYMHLEISALERAMDVLAEGFESIGIHLTPRQWYGPGQASATWMRGRIPKREEWLENQPDWFLDAARQSYYGGWFEVFCHGHIKRTVYEYDINSAYPAIIRRLPCLVHGSYSSGTGYPDIREGNGTQNYTLVKARVCVPGFTNRSDRNVERVRIGAMLHRSKDGSISRPSITEGWYWLGEIQAGIAAKCIDGSRIQYLEWVNYEACDCPPPFKEMEELYEVRLKVGKETPLGKSSKLVYNSGYGKFAQSIGDPQYGNPIYASLITSGCRQQILDAISTHPDGQRAVAMVATDAVFFLQPHPGLPLSKKLGEWEQTIRHSLTIFKPGVYWDNATREQIRKRETPKFKARGISATQFASEISRIDFWFNSWQDTGAIDWPEASFESGFSMITALQALMRNKWELAGKNDPKTMYHSSNPFRKRGSVYWDDEWEVWRTNIKWNSYDWEADDWDNVVSYPYEKRFGLEDPFSDESRDAMGITEDGRVSDLFSFLFRNED